MTQRITKAHAIAAARDYYERGKLGFQGGWQICRYDYGDGCRCAIGAALDGAHIKEAAPITGDVWRLKEMAIIDATPEDMSFLAELQDAHDCVCEAVRGDHSYKLAGFRKLIGLGETGS